jgi:hypothetical protein
MSRRFLSALVFSALAFVFAAAASNAVAADDVTNVVMGKGKTGTASRNSVVIVGDKIYVDGVLQEQRYKPGLNMVIRDDGIVFAPRDATKDAEKDAEKAAAKAERDREKEALKAAAKAEAQAEKEALKREAAAGLEKGRIKTSTGSVVNKGGTVRIGDKDYPDTGPATEKDIPPEALKAIEDAKRFGQ